MRILVSGSSGFIGKALCRFLLGKGHEVICLKRTFLGQIQSRDFIYWNAETGEGNVEDFERFDAVIHLAGESLVKGIWSQTKKRKILESRCIGTSHLVSLLEKTKNPPKIFLSTSAIGYYGSQENPVTEESLPGQGFLSGVCQSWEQASDFLQKKDVRVVRARLGLVLSSKGGLLKPLIPLFRLGLGCKIGNGKQMLSWICLEDVILAFDHILMNDKIFGAVNVVSPNPVTQEVFAKTLGKVLERPCFLKIPSWLIWGEKAKTLLLSSARVIPAKLLSSGFCFSYPNLEAALRHLLQ